MDETKFCKYCGEKIPFDAVICTKCGRQVEKLEKTENAQGNIIINNSNNNANVNNNTNNNVNANVVGKRLLNKWVSFGLCVFGGYLGLHKFYEGKMGMGLLYLCTGGLFFIGWVLDILSLLAKPNPYCI
jgi:restriction system protein